MSIIDTSHIEWAPAARDWFVFVEQHSDAHRFHCWHHFEAVVIAEYAVERYRQQSPQLAQALQRFLERSGSVATIVARQHTNVVLQRPYNIGKPPYYAFADVGVQITQMQNCEII